jgi:hypothetical protein
LRLRNEDERHAKTVSKTQLEEMLFFKTFLGFYQLPQSFYLVKHEEENAGKIERERERERERGRERERERRGDKETKRREGELKRQREERERKRQREERES